MPTSQCSHIQPPWSFGGKGCRSVVGLPPCVFKVGCRPVCSLGARPRSSSRISAAIKRTEATWLLPRAGWEPLLSGSRAGRRTMVYSYHPLHPLHPPTAAPLHSRLPCVFACACCTPAILSPCSSVVRSVRLKCASLGRSCHEATAWHASQCDTCVFSLPYSTHCHFTLTFTSRGPFPSLGTTKNARPACKSVRT